MGFNEILLLLTGVVCATLVVAAWKFDKERLQSAILLFLILVAVFGGKIVEFFGFATNTGNIFYASVFLATYFLIERWGKRDGIRTIWIGVIGVVAFSVLAKFTVELMGVPSTEGVTENLASAFEPMTRIAFASLLAYVMSQTLNVYLYYFLREKYPHFPLWARANLSNIVAQTLDSAVFFTVAFWAVVPPAHIGEILVTGFVIKVLFVLLASPLLYLNRIRQVSEKGYSTLELR